MALDKSKYPNIGLLMGDLEDRYQGCLWNGIEDAVRKHEANLYIFVGKSINSHIFYENQHNIIYNLVSKNYLDGLLLPTGLLYNSIIFTEFYKFISHLKPLPVVSVGVKLDGIPSVISDNKNGMRKIVNHLIEEHGYRRLAFIKGPDMNDEANKRFEGYREALAANKIPYNEDLILPGNFVFTSGEEAVRTLIEHRRARFDAIVASNDEVALAVIDGLVKRGISVPKDCAVVGFDNITEGKFSSVPLTTVFQPIYESAYASTELLLDIIKGKAVQDKITLPTRLVVRRSCGCFPQSITNIESYTINRDQKAYSLEEHIKKNKNFIIDEMLKALDPRLQGNDETRVWLEILIQILSHGKKTDNPVEEFLSSLHEILIKVIHADGEVSLWQNIISILHNNVMPYMKDADEAFTYQIIFQKARILIADIMQVDQYFLRRHSDINIWIFRNIMQMIIASLDMDELMALLTTHLPRVDIQSGYVVFYERQITHPESEEWKIPGTSKLMLAFTNGVRHDIDKGKNEFKTMRLIPAEYLPKNRRFSFVIKPLVFRDEHYGYILFEIGPREGSVYETLRIQVSVAIHTIQLLKSVKAASSYEAYLADLAKKFEGEEKKQIESFLTQVRLNRLKIGIENKPVEADKS
ncbi:MAG: substrate-binding domain-containing protein [Spirochaetales bacterium]|nr:substrate-binding domain-containing protein [Spirochaetales bacterium]